MKWAVVNEIGNDEKRHETNIVEAESATEAMLTDFSDVVLQHIAAEDEIFPEESATVAVYEVFENEAGEQFQGNFNHLIEINRRGDLARNMQKLLDEEKEKNEKYLVFDGSRFHKPSIDFQKEFGIKHLEVSLTEDGRIQSESISRYVNAECLSWAIYEKDFSEGDE